MNQTPTTLIVGHNGAGKSTMLDALSFALFGKSHRSISKNQLINSVNGKGCESIVEFSVGKHQFEVHRGIKPNKFEIYQNGRMINQSAAAKDYQKYLEQNILKLNHKSFHQIVVLGSSSFIPFMQLSSANRREVIEDILDIGIFSKMNTILKDKIITTRNSLTGIDNDLIVAKNNIDMQRKYIKDMTQLNQDQINIKHDSITKLENSIHLHELESARVAKEIEHLNQTAIDSLKESWEDKRQKTLEYKISFMNKIKATVKEAKFFDVNHVCPTCDQSISDDVKRHKQSEAKSRAKELQEGLDKANHLLASQNDTIEELHNQTDHIKEMGSYLAANERDIAKLRVSVADLHDEIESLTVVGGDLDASRQLLDDMVQARDTLVDRKIALTDQRSYNEAASEMLKDTGIKTKVIREYLPVINQLVNNYLQVMDFFVSFNLDDTFTETIKSRHRDAFTYSSFSEGEKLKIDLSLLFTWRQIARMKNSTNTSLLILDETFDSSLDNDGIEHLLKIIHGFEKTNTNCFIISHKGEQLEGKFQAKIEFEKQGNFSVMKDSE